jgi:RHS repeat-associated protein
VTSSNGNSLGQKEKTFQDQRYDDDLGLNWHTFKWRNYDASLARFHNIDPIAEEYVYNGTYNFSENRVIDGVELEGLEWARARNTNRTINRQYRRNTRAYTQSGATAKATYVRQSTVRLKEGFRLETTNYAQSIRNISESNNLTPSDPSEGSGNASGPGKAALKTLELASDAVEFTKTTGMHETIATDNLGRPFLSPGEGNIKVNDFDVAKKIVMLQVNYDVSYNSLAGQTKLVAGPNGPIKVPLYSHKEITAKLGPSPLNALGQAINEAMKSGNATESDVETKKPSQISQGQ